MKCTVKIFKTLLVLVAVCLTAGVLYGSASAQSSANKSRQGSMSGQGQTITVFGQDINPYRVRFRANRHNWDMLKHLLPEILPDANERELSSEELCDHVFEVSNEYLIETELITMPLIYEMEHVVHEGLTSPPADLALTDRLASTSQRHFNELLELMPDRHEELKRAKDITLKSLAAIILRDAALLECPAYAEEKKYRPVAAYVEVN